MVPIKTPLGQAELKARTRQVSQRHRTVLLLVDGRRGEQQVRSMAIAAGVPESCFDQLLDLGLIERAVLEPVSPFGEDTVPMEPPPATPEGAAGQVDSLLPAAATLNPESVIDNPPSVPDSWLVDEPTAVTADTALEQARELLMRAVRTQAPVAGALTLMRLRGAHSRAELESLLDEVESRISKPHRSLSAAQTVSRARHLLAEPMRDGRDNPSRR